MNANTERYLYEYYADDAKKLCRVVDRILSHFGGVTDASEFYSLADEVFVDVLRRYDNESSFDGFLYSCLDRKIKSEFTRRNRDKRTQYVRDENGNKVLDERGKYIIVHVLYLDAPIDEDGTTYGEMIAAKETDDEASLYEEEMLRYMERLSRKQRQIAEYLQQGFSPSEIREEMGISEDRYRMLFADMCSMSKTRNLKKLYKGGAARI